MDITRDKAREMLYGLRRKPGHIFSAEFIKKNGELRQMVCRLGVTKHLTGGGRRYDPRDYDLLTVFDMQKKAYRSINIATVRKLRIEGQDYSIAG